LWRGGSVSTDRQAGEKCLSPTELKKEVTGQNLAHSTHKEQLKRVELQQKRTKRDALEKGGREVNS